MTGVRARGEDIRRYILDHIEKFPGDIARKAAEHFGVTRQAANKHLQRLAAEKAITRTGQTRGRTYKLYPLAEWSAGYPIRDGLAEDLVWRSDVAPVLGAMPDNVLNLWHYGFTEMFNNAIDHSDGTKITVDVTRTAAATEMMITDDGVGIFRKIQTALGLLDERHALLELSKGKLTTDPQRHSGEGIFFSSRAFDAFQILSGEATEDEKGTSVRMRLHNHSARTLRKIFDQYSSGDEYGFNKTVVPVELARYGNDQLVSRSQAKRLVARVELFKVVVFDFAGIPAIGQAFADEIFRVFARQHPGVELVSIHASSAVKRMIERAKSGLEP